MLGIQIQTSKIDLKYSGTYHKLQKYTLITAQYFRRRKKIPTGLATPKTGHCGASCTGLLSLGWLNQLMKSKFDASSVNSVYICSQCIGVQGFEIQGGLILSFIAFLCDNFKNFPKFSQFWPPSRTSMAQGGHLPCPPLDTYESMLGARIFKSIFNFRIWIPNTYFKGRGVCLD